MIFVGYLIGYFLIGFITSVAIKKVMNMMGIGYKFTAESAAMNTIFWPVLTPMIALVFVFTGIVFIYEHVFDA